MLLVTGGAGFIGSNVVAALNEAGRSDIVVNDVLGADSKWRNLGKRQVADVVAPADLLRWLDGRKLDAVIHMGAISDTTATDADLVMENNFRLSLNCSTGAPSARVPFIYASSAATYRRRRAGFDDDWSPAALKRLKPMNLYGWSKHLFDQAVVERVVQEGKAAAAMGRAEILQRVRPERIPQGRDDEPRRQALRRRQGRPHGAAVQVAPAGHRATASSGATSSMSTTRSRWCAG